ncbi:Pentatricopeptide repeat-containing protein, mitochondrial, partial [Cucurbita argyrosperma subsp. argyrosperma]
MLFIFNYYYRIGRRQIRVHELNYLNKFQKGGANFAFVVNEVVYKCFDRFTSQPIACSEVGAFFSSSSWRDSSFGCSVRTYCSDTYGRNNGLDDANDELQKTDLEDSGDSSFFRNPNEDYEKDRHFQFGDDIEAEESNDEEDEGGDVDDAADLLWPNLSNKNHGQGNDFKRVEIGEDVFRSPSVKDTCKLIQLSSSWNRKFEGELRHLVRSLTPVQVCAVLLSLEDERLSLRFFYWADRLWRYRHDSSVYLVMLEILSRTKLCQGAKRVLRLMTRRGIQLWPEAFGFVMVSYSRAGRLRDAMKVLTLMQRAGVEPNLSICNTAIHILVVGNELKKALRFAERMVLIGIAPNVVTYNCLIKGYCNTYQVDQAMEMIDQMPSKGCSPDKVSYYTVMGFLCRDKRVNEIRELMKKMQTDSNLLPDHVTYNSLIHMLSKHGHGDEALEILREAEALRFKVDKVEYSAIVHAYCREGKINKAKELVGEMFSNGCAPDVVTYTSVLDGFCRIGKLDQAKKMMQQMYKHHCKPNAVTYTTLLNGLCRNGKSLEARKMMNMSEEEWWTPNAITYSVVVHGLRREGKLNEACDLVREMIGKGFFPNPVEINLLVQSLCRDGKPHEANQLLKECMNKGCAVNVVNFTTVIHGYCQKDDLEAALSLLDDMYLCNKHPDTMTYTTLIDALGKTGRIEEATEFTMKMLRQGLVPSPVTYRSVIHQYCRKGRVEDLLKLLTKMLAKSRFQTAYNLVIEKLCKFGYLEEANSLLAYKVACRMFNRNLLPDLKLCEKVSKRLLIEGNLEEADRLILSMSTGPLFWFIERQPGASQIFEGVTEITPYSPGDSTLQQTRQTSYFKKHREQHESSKIMSLQPRKVKVSVMHRLKEE